MPLSETVCPAFTLSEIVRVPVWVPACVGANTTDSEQWELAASWAVQLLVS